MTLVPLFDLKFLTEFAAGGGGTTLSPEDAAQGSAHDGAANGIAHRSADRLAKVARNLAGDTVHHRARHVARDVLADRQPLAAHPVGAEDTTECCTDAADPAADATGLARLLLAA